MTAICGIVATDGRPLSAGHVAGVMDELRPLAPLAEGTWAGRIGRGSAALGARDAAQPLRSADSTLCLVADVTLDCRGELLARLPAAATASDPQLVLAAYERWGVGCLDVL